MRGARTALVIIAAVVCLPIVFVLMLVVHECGHTVVAWLLGDRRATFRLYGGGCVGCNLYDSQRLSAWGNVAVNLGGLWGTMTLTAAATGVLAWRGARRWVPWWLPAEVIFVCFAGDFVWQFVQAVQQLPVPAREPVGWGLAYTDLDAATSFAGQATGWSHPVIAAIGFGAGAIYMIALAVAIRWAWRRVRQVRPVRPAGVTG